MGNTSSSIEDFLPKKGGNGVVDLDWTARFSELKITKMKMLVRPVQGRDSAVTGATAVGVGATAGYATVAAVAVSGPIGLAALGVGAAITKGFRCYLNGKLMHHAVYFEVDNGRYCGIIDFNISGLDQDLLMDQAVIFS